MILLTGTSGFIGSNLLDTLLKHNKDVVALTSKPITKAKYILHNGYNFNFDLIQSAGYGNLIETIVHVGAFTPKNSEQANKIHSCNQNIFNLEKLLDLTLPNLKKVIFLSTLDVYDDTDVVSEETTISPRSLYGYSKIYSEKMITAFAESRGIIGQILRIGHVYGSGEEKYEKLIPETMKRILADEAVDIWGDGTELRSFIYIDDVVKAIINSIYLSQQVGPINVVSENSLSIEKVVKGIIEISGAQVKVNYLPRKGLARNLKFDTQKMKRFLLSTETDMRTGLKIEWNYMMTLKS